MAVLEAWAHGKPVLMTPECNLPEGFAADAAIRIAPTAEGSAHGLHTWFSLLPAQRSELGRKGYELVASRYT